MKLITDKDIQNIPIEIINHDTFLRRLIGLMFRIKPIVNEGIWLHPCNSIHMFFMFFAIDVVFLNENQQIISFKKNVKPWTIIPPVKKAVSVLELPNGTISTYSFQIGDTIDW
ncbi:DUF192 domain-containing protein [Bacillus tuaregi]|uniref:DUF192 domain-containing protein n=1 Tax=Bacillus tuaregi TaxID=1816695 RepID=UPI0008F867BC|nr:DUF192 domain-containing protein [Bacillus tuaregi]